MFTVRNDSNLLVLTRDELKDKEAKAYEEGYRDALSAHHSTAKPKKTVSKATMKAEGKTVEYRNTVAEDK